MASQPPHIYLPYWTVSCTSRGGGPQSGIPGPSAWHLGDTVLFLFKSLVPFLTAVSSQSCLSASKSHICVSSPDTSSEPICSTFPSQVQGRATSSVPNQVHFPDPCQTSFQALLIPADGNAALPVAQAKALGPSLTAICTTPHIQLLGNPAGSTQNIFWRLDMFHFLI